MLFESWEAKQPDQQQSNIVCPSTVNSFNNWPYTGQSVLHLHIESSRCNMNDENDKSSVVSKASLLGLPRELRDKIYRNLHLNAKPLYYPSGAVDADSHDKFEWDELVGCNLSSGLFRVCRQVYEEGSAILWGENVFAFKVWEQYGEERATFLRAPNHIENSRKRRVPIHRIKKYKILVEIHLKEQFWSTRSSVRKVCQTLSDSPVLQQLNISLEIENEEPDNQISSRVLEPFALLRHVSTVTIDGVSPQYALYLKSVMEGSAPLDYLPKMYQALQSFAGPFDHCEEYLQMACQAMEDCDSERFKHIREMVIDGVDTHMKLVRAHLFDHDAKIDSEASGNSSSERSKGEAVELLGMAD